MATMLLSLKINSDPLNSRICCVKVQFPKKKKIMSHIKIKECVSYSGKVLLGFADNDFKTAMTSRFKESKETMLKEYRKT